MQADTFIVGKPQKTGPGKEIVKKDENNCCYLCTNVIKRNHARQTAKQQTRIKMTTSIKSILEKVQKILALSEKAGTEAEAQAAMDMAQVLLAKHNLSMSQVEAHDSNPQEKIEMDESAPQYSRQATWEGYIVTAIAKLYFCKVFVRSSRGVKRDVYVGKPSNVAIAQAVTASLITTGKQIADRQSKIVAQQMADDGIQLNRRAWLNSFLLGYSDKIYSRAREQVARAGRNELKDETGTALVLAPLYQQEERAVTAFMDQTIGKLRAGRSSAPAIRSRGAYQQGQIVGSNASLSSNGISHTKQTRLA